MNLIKNSFILIIIIASFLYSIHSIYFNFLNPCAKTIEYSIGEFHNNFGVSKENFLSYIKESEKTWEDVLKKNVFVYKEGSDFKINLIYDERQKDTEVKQKIEFGLTASEENFKNLDSQFEAMKRGYEESVSTYENNLKIFKERQAQYEEKVKHWNSKGGAPANIFQSLKQEESILEREALILNEKIIFINNMAKDLNSLLERRNLAAEDHNRVAKNYNQKYGHGLEFNQAEYFGGGINVFQFLNKQDLVVALVHEFGHSLGMDHTQNSNSIMYYSSSGEKSSRLIPTEEDILELKRVCKLK